MIDFQVEYNNYLNEFNAYAKEYTDTLVTNPSILGESMAYSLLNGGKRVRPVLMLACADALKVAKEEVLPFALALEMIHTYSLVHDDLPSMDNDDFRRGKPSNHKRFGEANAILAGDALLNEAYALCFKQCQKGERHVLAAQFLNECAGVYGMIAGQSADLYFSNSGKEVSETDLQYVYAHKTGKLLLAPVAIVSILSDKKEYAALERFGTLLGELFQTTDDILDVTGDFASLGKSIGKDEAENKLTCIRLYGLEGAKARAESCAKRCRSALDNIKGNTEFLYALVDYVLNRAN